MGNIYKKIFRDLYESTSGLYAFTFYSRYKIAPSLLFQFIEKFKEEDIITFSDGKINLTEKGKQKATQLVKNYSSTKNKFTKIPGEFLDNKIRIDSLYLPNIDSILKEKKVG